MIKRKLASERPCKHCGKLFKPREDQVKKGLGIFCSRSCGGIGRRIIPNVSKKKLEILYKQEKSIHRVAKKLGYSWKPIYRLMKEYGIDTSPSALRQKGTYETCYRPNTKERVAKHRDIVEQKLGRKLKKEEIVHHVDLDRQNNSKRNLYLTTRKGHNKIHKQLATLSMVLYRNGLIIFKDGEYTFSKKMEVVLDGEK